ncbi:MAG: carbamoyltransferase C-terminal domain-containing protein [Candidatus Omnitrophica bacterium]|nr:carbamoyltransferase C-terminal domain-containing protein [Candidatus Omnitrophota bacterium]
MSRYAGCKPVHHDASLFIVDVSSKTLFGLALERVTRIKRDSGHIALMGDYLRKFDTLHFSFGSCSELQGLRQVLPIVFGLEEHPAREILRNPLISSKEKLERISRLDPKITNVVKGWLEFLSLTESDLIRHQKITDAAWLKLNSNRLPWVKKITLHDHHTCHAVGAYLHCGFDDCAIVTLDGYGDGCFSKVFHARNGKVIQHAKSDLRWTWGYLYANATRLLGYYPNADEGKVEALASFGTPSAKLYDALMQGYAITPNLSIVGKENYLLKYWNIHTLTALRDQLGRENFAATIQAFLEDKAVEYMRAVRNQLGGKVACAGGIFGNVSMNQAIFERAGFEQIFIMPAMNDSGSAQGAAYLAALEAGENLDWIKEHDMPFWGPSYSENQILSALETKRNKIKFEKITDGEKRIAKHIFNNKILALFRGPQEWGPRALGHRSLLANAAGGIAIKNRINGHIKRRESFQPFCPSMLAEECNRLFVSAYQNKHMTSAFKLRDEHLHALEAIAHINGTARPQFVTKKGEPFLYSVLAELKQLTGYGVVLNTSFNLHGRAMVLTPEDAITDFLDCVIDALYLQGYWVTAK